MCQTFGNGNPVACIKSNDDGLARGFVDACRRSITFRHDDTDFFHIIGLADKGISPLNLTACQEAFASVLFDGLQIDDFIFVQNGDNQIVVVLIFVLTQTGDGIRVGNTFGSKIGMAQRSGAATIPNLLCRAFHPLLRLLPLLFRRLPPCLRFRFAPRLFFHAWWRVGLGRLPTVLPRQLPHRSDTEAARFKAFPR